MLVSVRALLYLLRRPRLGNVVDEWLSRPTLATRTKLSSRVLMTTLTRLRCVPSQCGRFQATLLRPHMVLARLELSLQRSVRVRLILMNSTFARVLGCFAMPACRSSSCASTDGDSRDPPRALLHMGHKFTLDFVQLLLEGACSSCDSMLITLESEHCDGNVFCFAFSPVLPLFGIAQHCTGTDLFASRDGSL